MILYGAMFDFADVIENGILCLKHPVHLCVICPLAIVIQEIQGKYLLNKSKHARNTNGKICYFKKSGKQAFCYLILICYKDA